MAVPSPSEVTDRGRAARRHRVVGRVAFYTLVVLLVLPAVFSQILISPHRQPTEAAPAGVEEAWLRSADGLRLRAWILPGTPDVPAAVVVHGLGDTLESYMAVAEILRGRGHAVLLVDLRGHGASEGSVTTLGGLERADVRAGMDTLRRTGRAGRGLVVLGFSMGAVAALRAAADQSDVCAVVVESPFDTYRDTVAHHARLLYGLPRWVPIIPVAIAMAEWRAGFDADDVDAVAAAARVRAPLLAIVDGGDARMPERVVRRVVAAHPGPGRVWVARDASHVGAILDPEFWPTVLGFLSESGCEVPEPRPE